MGDPLIVESGAIRRVTAQGTIVTLVSSYNPVWWTAVRSPRDGRIFLADQSHRRVDELLPNGTLRTVAGGGSRPPVAGVADPATAVSLLRPTGLAVDRNGTLYIADGGSRRVFAVRFAIN
jgi:sugar lactone lactonase YvrE